MSEFNPIAAGEVQQILKMGGAIVGVLLLLILAFIVFRFGKLWIQAYMSGADVSWVSLIGMALRGVDAKSVVKAQVMTVQAGISIADGNRGNATASLEAHYLAGGDVERVILAIISAHRAGIDLRFDRAAAIDLAGRDVLEAVRTSIFPKVISCPDVEYTGNNSLSSIAKDGIELLTQVRVTVRTNLDQLIGGATEETIIARVGEGIISSIGSMSTYKEALANPNLISRNVLEQGIQSNTAYEIVSIDIASIDVGRNIGSRLQSEEAEADTRVARAEAEVRRADAIALEQEMKAKVTLQKAKLVLAESEIPAGLAEAFRSGQLKSLLSNNRTKKLKPTGTDGVILPFSKQPPNNEDE